jgi:membrane peptidoglycan carboxypeptidase
MLELGMIRPSAERAARRSGLGISPKPPRLSIKQPYFVEAVKREILADERLAPTPTQREKALYRGGLRISTTLRPRIQDAAEDAVASVLDRPGDPQAALVAIEPSTGRIVAMVGGRNWEDSQVNLAMGSEGGGSGRQPGSAFKPIVAAAALETGISIDAPYEATGGVFELPDGSTWSVDNNEGGGAGKVPVYEAIVHSVNGVFARLGLQVGPDRVASQASLMGVKAELPIYPSIALGASEVSVLDMATAYATLANKGTYVEPTTIEEIRTNDGEVLRPVQDTVRSVVSQGNLYLLTEALQDVIVRGTGTAASIGRPAAGKTGTTDDHADAWFVGFTPDLVAAVWVGYPEGRIPMTNVHGITVYGGTFPASIWRAFMLRALENVPPSDFDLSHGDIVTPVIDPETGLLAEKWCKGKEMRMLQSFVPTAGCPPPVPGSGGGASPTPSPSSDGGEKEPSEPSPEPVQPEPEPEPDGG